MTSRSDNEIVSDYLGGDSASFEVIVKRYLKSIYNLVFRLSGSENEASDIAQEVFVKVWKSLRKFDTSKNFRTWILTITRNTTIDWLRKRRNISFSRLDSPSENGLSFEESITDMEPLPDEIFARKELEKELKEIILKIRPDFREVLFLRYSEDLTFEEISQITGKPLNTVKSHHLRALNAIRKLLI